jgi:hypothetical protein
MYASKFFYGSLRVYTHNEHERVVFSLLFNAGIYPLLSGCYVQKLVSGRIKKNMKPTVCLFPQLPSGLSVWKKRCKLPIRCGLVGRDHTMTPEAAIEYFARLAALGVDHAIFSLTNVSDLEPFEVLTTAIVPDVCRLSVAGLSKGV